MAKTCLDSIPTLTALASKQGFLEEKHFADAGLWQTEEEKEAEEKNPRDDLALYRQRAILLTSAGFRARTEARRKELETNRRAKEDKKKDEKEQAERKKCLKRAWKELKCDQDTGCPLPKKKLGSAFIVWSGLEPGKKRACETKSTIGSSVMGVRVGSVLGVLRKGG